ncbi:PEP-CTERM sorting domain-containing protein [bacterium]|nr:PEP-CTERM sorting domain-containing protein [bacterium]
MSFRTYPIIALAMTVAGFSGIPQAHAGIVAFSGFDQGLEGWTSNTPAEVKWQAAGGNPGGFAQFVDGSSGETWFDAPAPFLGNLGAMNETGTISYDHRLVQIGSQNNGIVPLEVRLSGPGGQAFWLGTIPPESTLWNSIVVPFQQSAWTVSSGNWDAILADVTSLRIRFEHVDNGFRGPTNRETVTIDNVTLTANPVPEPASIVSLLIAGALGAGYRMRRRKRIDVS